MKKKILLVLFILISFNTYSQDSFHPVLAKDTCQWSIPRLSLDEFWMDTIWALKESEDTFLLALKTPHENARIYGKLYSSLSNDKLFFMDLESHESIMIMDLSLVVGDTFTIYDEYSQARNLIVDSIYYDDGKKHIQFDDEIGLPSYSYFYIHPKKCCIEGVGPNWGFCLKEEGTTLFVCKHEGDILYYSYPDTSIFIGCTFNNNIFGDEVRLVEKSHLSIWPNPTTDILNINLSEKVRQLSIYSSSGILCHSIDFDAEKRQNYSFDMSKYSKGVYFIHVILEDTQKTFKIIKK